MSCHQCLSLALYLLYFFPKIFTDSALQLLFRFYFAMMHSSYLFVSFCYRELEKELDWQFDFTIINFLLILHVIYQ